jgi:NAD(P)-dependent dehydrogenase (short-subunit alcohol dehydrogenase family)
VQFLSLTRDNIIAKTWCVTGATRGIGAEIVKAVLKAGDRVVATGGDLQKIEQAGTFGYVPVDDSRREFYQR